jgi:geranylgeranyl reductase family protein
VRIDAAIVGAGPSGLLAATTISKKSYRVQVYEEHSVVGEPNHCAGLVSVEGLVKLGIKPNESFTQNTIIGGRIYAPNGEYIEIRDTKPRAHVIDRGEFDRHLAQRAHDYGVEILTSARVEKLAEKNRYNVGLKTGDGSIESRIVIDAEGSGSRLIQQILPGYKKPRSIPGINVEVSGVEVESDLVEVWFTEELAKGFFIWVIPLSGCNVRCGLATSEGNPVDNLRKFIKKRFSVEDISDIWGGSVVTGGPVSSTISDGLMVVGDAAGHVKPTTGGGVVMGGLCSRIAGGVAIKALEEEDCSKSVLRPYEAGWRGEYGSEFRSMLALRNLMNSISDARFNRLFEAFKESGLQNVVDDLVHEGDIDMQAGVIRRAITDPKMLGFLIRGLGRATLGELFSTVK